MVSILAFQGRKSSRSQDTRVRVSVREVFCLIWLLYSFVDLPRYSIQKERTQSDLWIGRDGRSKSFLVSRRVQGAQHHDRWQHRQFGPQVEGGEDHGGREGRHSQRDEARALSLSPI